MKAKTLAISAVALTAIMGVGMIANQLTFATHLGVIVENRKAPVEISGDNIYVT